ncbi:MAG: hypothetical protein ACRD1F_07510, partial [Terriglobales bacterium]
MALALTLGCWRPARAQKEGLIRFAMAGEAIASQYQWHEMAEVSAPAGGVGTVVLPESSWTLPDGTMMEPFAVGVPVTVEDGAATETVVPTASTCVVGGPAPCTLTAVFRYAHQSRAQVISGTAGLLEAARSVSAGGGTVLLTPGQYTIGTSITLPANVALRVRAGAMLVIPPAVTLTLDGPLQAGNYPIFSTVAPRQVSDAAMAAGSDVITSASAGFSAQDVGTKLYVSGASAARQFGVQLPLTGTVVAVSSPTTATASFVNGSGAALAAATMIVGGGYVSFGPGHTPALNPAWWGADPTGSQDSTAALNAAFTAGGDADIPVVIPPGQYLTGHLHGGDPMQAGNYSPNEAQVTDAATIRGSGPTLQGGGGAGETDLIYDGPPSAQYVLQQQNMQGVGWSGFTVDGRGNAPCIDAEWVIVNDSGGPSAQDTFRQLTTENCAGTAMDFDNDNDSVIRGLRGISVANLTTAATGAVSAGTRAPLPVASPQGLRPDESVVVGGGATQETIVVAAAGAGGITPVDPWADNHSAGEPVVIPAVGLSLVAGTGEQSVSDVRLAQGLLLFDVQNGAVNGGFLAAGLETGFGSFDAIALNGPQIWPNPVLKAAILVTGSASAPVAGVACTGCMLTIFDGDAAVAGIWQQGATFTDSFIILAGSGEVFGAVSASAQTPPVFVFDHSQISGGTPNSPAGVTWVIHDGVQLGGAGGTLYPDSYGNRTITISTPFTGVTPLLVSGAAGAVADLEDWAVNGAVVDSVDAAGRLRFDGNTAGAAPPAASGGALSWNYSGGQGEVDFWDDFALAQNGDTAFEWNILDAGDAPHQVARLDRSGDFTTAGELAAPGLSLNGGAELSGQTGTGTEVATNVAPVIQGATLADAELTGSLTLPAAYQAGGATLTQPATSGTLALTSQLPLAATTAAIGGGALSAG